MVHQLPTGVVDVVLGLHELLARYMRDAGEMWTRCERDVGDIWARYARDAGEMWTRCERDVRQD